MLRLRNVLVSRKYTLKILEVVRHQVSNSVPNGSGKKVFVVLYLEIFCKHDILLKKFNKVNLYVKDLNTTINHICLTDTL